MNRQRAHPRRTSGWRVQIANTPPPDTLSNRHTAEMGRHPQITTLTFGLDDASPLLHNLEQDAIWNNFDHHRTSMPVDFRFLPYRYDAMRPAYGQGTPEKRRWDHGV